MHTRINEALTMGSVRVISSSTIQAPSHNKNTDSTQKIDLTPWDLQLLPLEPIQDGLIFQHHHQVSKQIIIQRLKHSFSSTLAFFPPLAGRLIITEHEDETVSCFIACNNIGALFVHAIAENTGVADILRPNYVPPIVRSFFPLNGVKNFEGTSQPLLAVQVTELLDGIFFGYCVNHAVADGESLWHFVNSWAEMSRGSPKLISKLPALERWFPNGVDPPIRFHFTAQNKQHSELSCLNPINPPVSERIFHFTKDKIARLKSKANAEANTDKISSLQALLTHVWRTVVRCKGLHPQEEVRYALPIGVRPRLIPTLPEGYFGNATLPGVVTVKAGELLEEGTGLGKGAWEMNKVISCHSDDKLKNLYECWLMNPRLFSFGRMTNRNSFFLATSNSPRFNVYDGNDFGWGKPVAVRSGGGNRRNGKITVFAGSEEGSMDVTVYLPYEILEAMEKDPDFMEYEN